MAEVLRLTSTTAPGKYFSTREELANHYKSDWHKYNLKRREAGLPLVLESDFQARLEAALAMRREEEQHRQGGGTDHLKNKKAGKHKKNKQHKKNQQQQQQGPVTVSYQAQAYEDIKQEQRQEEPEKEQTTMDVDKKDEDTTKAADPATDNDETKEDNATAASSTNLENNIVIDPKQCLFDKHISKSVEANVDRMYRKYGFFIPDREYLFDVEGLVGYCHEKIKLGHYCLYCHSMFKTWQGCQKHMISKRHTKLRYEHGFDLDELSVFYDFTKADEQFLSNATNKKNVVENETKEENEDVVMENEDDDDEGDWEDISDDEEGAEDDDDNNENNKEDMDGFEEQLAQYGFDVTPLGELILPDGRIVGHRTLSRYYKQRITPTNPTNTAALTAKYTAGERLYDGQVINLNDYRGTESYSKNAMVLAKAGISPNAIQGRAGKGILVKQDGIYSATSVYRYRAMLKKQRRDDEKGQRLYHKTKQNINRMDKKANRLMNGVSVAHAAR